MDIYPRVGLLDETVPHFLVFKENSILFAIVNSLFFMGKLTSQHFSL